MRLSIFRYNPEADQSPYTQDYEVALQPGDRMLLDVLMRIREQDDSLTFRKSCREGVCGSDGMNINGRNGLACVTPLAGLKEPVVLRPLPRFSVVRDLVVDLSGFFQQYRSIKPYVINHDPAPEKERLQSAQERARLDGLYECILCALLHRLLPVILVEIRTSSWGRRPCCRPCASSLTAGTKPRRSGSQRWTIPTKLFRCRSIMNCTEVCPRGLNPAREIEHIRTEMVRKGLLIRLELPVLTR